MSELPAGWVWAKLGDLLTRVEAGKSFKCEERPPGPDEVGVVKVSAVRWGASIDEESKTCLDADRVNPALFIQAGDFLFSRANTIDLVGACVIAGPVLRRVMLSDKILRFRFADDRLKPWVLRYLRSRSGRQQIEALSTGNQESMRNIGQQRIGQIEVPLPPQQEGQRIGLKMDELFVELEVGISELKTAQVKLQSYRQSLLKAAVQGDLTADWRAANPPAETGAELLRRVLAERCARWEAAQQAKAEAAGKPLAKGWQAKYEAPSGAAESALPQLPPGWAQASADQLSWEGLANGRSVPTAESGAKVLRLTAIRRGQVDLAEHKCGDWTEVEAKPFSVTKGDLLIVRGNGSLQLVGRCGLVGDVPFQVAYPDTLIRLRVMTDLVDSAWLAAVWDSQHLRSHLEGRARTSAGIYKIAQPDIQSAPVPVPPLGEALEALRLLQDQLEVCDSMQAAIDKSLAQCTAQRQNILRAAFAGQLVPQDPTDEPAEALLARIRAGQEGANPPARKRTARAAAGA